ncbi:hypothetical protein D3C77_581810 [compost metagenome]
MLGLWLAWRPVTPGRQALLWDGEWLEWQGRRHRLDDRSRILPGVLWLRLVTEEGAERHLWLFSDALAPEHYRALARAIHLAPSNPPASPHNR